MTNLIDRSHWLEEHGRSWAEAGLVTPDQLEAIERYERTSPPAPAEPEVVGMPLAAEFVLYLAAILVGTGSTFMVTRFWDRLGGGGRVAIALAVTAVGYLAAMMLEPVEAPSFRRLAALTRLVGTAGLALSAGVLAVELGSESPPITTLCVGLPVLIAGSLDWRNEERPLGLFTTVVGLTVTGIALGSLADIWPWVAGGVTWVVGATMVGLGLTERLRPALWAAVFGAIGAMAGAVALGATVEIVRFVAPMVTAALVITAGLAARRTPITAIGVVGFLIFLQSTLARYLRGVGGGIGVLLIGVVILVVVVPRLTRAAGSGRAHTSADATEGGSTARPGRAPDAGGTG